VSSAGNAAETARGPRCKLTQEVTIVDTIASKLEETGRHAARQRDGIVEFVRTESAGWQRFASRRAATVRGDIASALSPKGLERRVLGVIDAALRSLDGKVRARMALLDGAKSRRKRNGKNGRGKATKAATMPAALAGTSRH
jgi:hypothetical protein